MLQKRNLMSQVLPFSEFQEIALDVQNNVNDIEKSEDNSIIVLSLHTSMVILEFDGIKYNRKQTI